MVASSDEHSIKEVFNKVLNGRQPYNHQLETVKNLLKEKSVILRAPCGSGKTEACYVSLLLGRSNVLPNRLIYSLPTRALVEDVAHRIRNGITRTECSVETSCQHGANPGDKFFKKDIVITTIDQMVGSYCCTPLSLPVHLGNIPAGAAVSSFLCFDEAHVYDHQLGLQVILVLVERATKVGLPFLIMSATLPDSFVNWFRENEEFVHKIAIVEGRDRDIPKRLNRKVVLECITRPLGKDDVLKYADSWNKIMVVCNTVGKAQELYRKVEKELKKYGFNVFLLHSRFLQEDRKRIEDWMKSCFEALEKKSCLITTQVCEVGLDISCKLLLTELAPPDALIQRMGRCARKGGEGKVLVFDVKHSAPYKDKELEKTRKYLYENLDGKRVGWNEELEFVNALLSKEFEQSMKNRRRRNEILVTLGNAAFKGSRYKIESTIREVLSANLTIHNNPTQLKYWEMLNMPWIRIDIRVLRKYLNKAIIWQIDFGHDEYGKREFEAFLAKKLDPYKYYVIHPDHAKYDPNVGLIIGEEGENLTPSNLEPEQQIRIEYERETWEKHVENCLHAYTQIRKLEQQSLRMLAELIECNLYKTEGLVALSLVLHDLGKLNEKWQEEVGGKRNSAPLAHIPLDRKIGIPHATVSAYAVYPLFKYLLKNAFYALVFELAIAHHHHTRAERVPSYKLGWQHSYTHLVDKICRNYRLDISNIPKKIIDEIPSSTRLDTSFFDIDRQVKLYSAYCIIARIIRLCDQASFAVDKLQSKIY